MTDTTEQPAEVNDEQRKKVLWIMLEAMGEFHDRLDELRFHPRGSMGAVIACSGVGTTREDGFDYDIEMSQRGLETSIMRIQQAIADIDPEVCSLIPCSDQRGPCEKHATPDGSEPSLTGWPMNADGT